jgi:hypothetical protein
MQEEPTHLKLKHTRRSDAAVAFILARPVAWAGMIAAELAFTQVPRKGWSPNPVRQR